MHNQPKCTVNIQFLLKLDTFLLNCVRGWCDPNIHFQGWGNALSTKVQC